MRKKVTKLIPRGNCPVHNIPMGQIGSGYDGAVVACPRKDCDQNATIPWQTGDEPMGELIRFAPPSRGSSS